MFDLIRLAHIRFSGELVVESNRHLLHVVCFGGTEYRLGRREIGHVHGNYLVDIPFPTKIRNELVEAGRAEPHHILPETGWVSFFLREPDDVDRAIDLLHYSYELASKQKIGSTQNSAAD